MEVDISSSPRLIKQSLSNSVTRYNRARLERLRRAREEADFEKIFKQSFWSYSKSMLKQPLSVLEGEKGDELEDIALKLFYTIQQHAGIYIYSLCKLQTTLSLHWCLVCVCVHVHGRDPSIQWVRIHRDRSRWLCHNGTACNTKMPRERVHLQWVLFTAHQADNRPAR